MGNCPTARLLGLVEALVLASGQPRELALQEVAAQRRETVREDITVDMVVLVLYDTGRKTRELLVVLDEVLVDIAHAYRDGTAYILVQSRQRETSLVEEVRLL